jgi:hypothetical protein
VASSHFLNHPIPPPPTPPPTPIFCLPHIPFFCFPKTLYFFWLLVRNNSFEGLHFLVMSAPSLFHHLRHRQKEALDESLGLGLGCGLFVCLPLSRCLCRCCCLCLCLGLGSGLGLGFGLRFFSFISCSIPSPTSDIANKKAHHYETFSTVSQSPQEPTHFSDPTSTQFGLSVLEPSYYSSVKSGLDHFRRSYSTETC